MDKVYYEENQVGILDIQRRKGHSLDGMVGEALLEKVTEAKVFNCSSNPCSP